MTREKKHRKRNRGKGRLAVWGEYLSARLVTAVLRLLPERFAVAAGKAVGRVAWLAKKSNRELARQNLRKAMPELSDKELDRLLKKVFVNLGLGLVEMFWSYRRINKAEVERRFTVEGLQQVLDVTTKGQSLVAATLHLGTWEFFGSAISLLIGGLNPLAKPASNPLMEKLLARQRNEVLIRPLNTEDGIRPILTAAKTGARITIMMDQHVRAGFLPIRFFGREAATTTLPAVLALRFNIPVFLAYSYREGESFHHHAVLELLQLIRTGDHDADVEANTKLFSERLEQVIRQHPEQWLWMYRRWRYSDRLEEPQARGHEPPQGSEREGSRDTQKEKIGVGR
jgi:KDO2-lipid IV(A) lauroyltransferase